MTKTACSDDCVEFASVSHALQSNQGLPSHLPYSLANERRSFKVTNTGAVTCTTFNPIGEDIFAGCEDGSSALYLAEVWIITDAAELKRGLR